MKTTVIALIAFMLYGCETTKVTSSPQVYTHETVFSGSFYPVEEVDIAPKVITRVAPVYPVHLKRERIQGNAVVWFIVDVQGNPTQIQVEEATNEEFAQSTIDSIKKWKYEPGIKNGQPVATKIRIPISFSMRN